MSAALSAPPTRRRRELVTPEGIALPITIASRGSRLVALVIDYTAMILLMILLSYAAWYIVGSFEGLKKTTSEVGEFVMVVALLTFFVIWNGYFMFFEMGPRGATPGKRILKIRVASRDGGRLTPEAVVARNLLRQIEIFLPLSFLSIAGSGESGAGGFAGALWFLVFMLFPFFNRDALRAGDLIAGTWVLEAPRVQLAEAMSVDQADAALPQYRFDEAELSIYGEHELKTLEDVLRRGDPNAMATVQQAILRKIGWEGGAGHEREFLEAFYRALRARLEGEMRFGKRKRDKFDDA
ncbi:RDD family protein [Erythrobacter sp. SDW2]|uniref:RDD family protein n=1 Tax=Erythrobacter sp. SDW2 TaxID=2907154 RepID=UPI001F1E06B0|nr:RDD family protein [Erythrobacter sp. SDW2]UIP06778.1 RDD family protein [Erythrobacter sp. SDW2]